MEATFQRKNGGKETENDDPGKAFPEDQNSTSAILEDNNKTQKLLIDRAYMKIYIYLFTPISLKTNMGGFVFRIESSDIQSRNIKKSRNKIYLKN